MREIKFRAWNSIDKCFCDNTTTLTNLRQFIKSKHYHQMQYTGLKDKNGIEIYEGDIVKVVSSGSPDSGVSVCEVAFKDGCFGYLRNGVLGVDFKAFKFKQEWNDGYCSGTERLSYEVIGNIYENPELLEK